MSALPPAIGVFARKQNPTARPAGESPAITRASSWLPTQREQTERGSRFIRGSHWSRSNGSLFAAMASGRSDSDPAFDLGVRRSALIAPRGAAASSRNWAALMRAPLAAGQALSPAQKSGDNQSTAVHVAMSTRHALQRKTIRAGADLITVEPAWRRHLSDADHFRREIGTYSRGVAPV